MAARGHVVSLFGGSVHQFLGETSEKDAEKFAKEHSGEKPIISLLGGAEAYDLSPSMRKFLQDHCGFWPATSQANQTPRRAIGFFNFLLLTLLRNNERRYLRSNLHRYNLSTFFGSKESGQKENRPHGSA